MNRRQFMSLCVGATCQPIAAAWAQESPLRLLASRKSKVYGVAVASEYLRNDSIYATIVAEQADLIVAEYEMKRAFIQPEAEGFNFGAADDIVKFAEANAQHVRGHTLVWHAANPAWLEAALQNGRETKLLTDYVSKVVRRFRGKVRSWDVVNEAVEPLDQSPDGLRSSSPWYKTFGPEYIEIAFHAAREADPAALLFYNETNLESEAASDQQRRSATLKLLERLVAKNVPVGAFGLQSHLKLYRARYTQETLSKFLDEIAAMGLSILITEFDVADIKGPLDPKKRDHDVAALTRMYLDAALSKQAVLGCVTWGITDKYSWLSKTPAYQWPNGELSRGLPYDSNYARKPMWDAIASAFT